MIIGNPYKFSIFVQEIKEWNPEGTSFRNGVLLFSIDGELFPKQVTTATLSSETGLLKELLMNVDINKKLFNMRKEDAFIEMYNITFPRWDPDMKDDEVVYNDYRYFLTPTSFSDLGYHVYAVSDGTKVRILAAKLNYIVEESIHDLSELEISETIITKDELKQINDKLFSFLQ